MCLLYFWMAFLAKTSLIDSAMSEPILTALFGLLLLAIAGLIRRSAIVLHSKRVPHPAVPVNRTPIRHIPDFRIAEVPPSRIEVSEQAASN
jgi:hypothetical protein